ncbi:MAG TPA: WecB/TagA/CpsF family glycosyltransferase [Anaerolineales bacterium]|nr:WecB/TagA/CpsF family glycosyltransferase [Anaerolineales bacterium]
MRKLVIILCAPIDNLNMQEALTRVEDFIAEGRRTGKTHQIATVNADFVVKAISDPELRQLLQEVDMATADGMPLVWGARILGTPLEERVAGADMVPALAELSARKRYSMFFLGAAPGVAARAADILQTRYPGLQIVGVVSPPVSSIFEMDRAIIEQIKNVKPDILLVAFGNPKQEKWIGMYGRELGVPVMIGVGGTFDFIAGQTKRAPVWMQRIGFEWLFRLAQEPKRLWKRYVVDLTTFGSFFLRQWWLTRQKPLPTPLLPTADVILVEQTAILNIVGRADFSNSTTISQKGLEALDVVPHLIVNLSQATFLDSMGVGALVGLAKRAQDLGGSVKLAAVPDTVMKVLTMLRLNHFFEIIPSLEDGLGFSQPTPVIKTEQNGKWQVYPLPRRFDAETSPTISEACTQLLHITPYLILDFQETTFLASAGLAVLLNIKRLAEEKGGALRLATCSADVQTVIKMVRFDKVFALYPDLSSATTDSP